MYCNDSVSVKIENQFAISLGGYFLFFSSILTILLLVDKKRKKNYVIENHNMNQGKVKNS